MGRRRRRRERECLSRDPPPVGRSHTPVKQDAATPATQGADGLPWGREGGIKGKVGKGGSGGGTEGVQGSKASGNRTIRSRAAERYAEAVRHKRRAVVVTRAKAGLRMKVCKSTVCRKAQPFHHANRPAVAPVRKRPPKRPQW